MRAEPSLADDPERQVTLRQADQAREDFAAVLDDLDFVKLQLARVPDRAWLGYCYSASEACGRCSAPSRFGWESDLARSHGAAPP